MAAPLVVYYNTLMNNDPLGLATDAENESRNLALHSSLLFQIKSIKPLLKHFLPLSLILWACCGLEGIAQSYGNVVMGGGGYVTGIITCSSQPNLIYAKTDVGGAYRWDEATQSWIPLLDWLSQNQVSYMGVESLAVDPQSPGILYILAGTSYWNGGITAILRSTNYGTNFTITDVTSKFKANGNGSDRNKGESLAVDPNLGSIVYCGSRANGLFKSTDSGATWNVVSSLNIGTSNISFVKFDALSGTPGSATPRIFVGVFALGTNFYVSNDAGNTWTALTNSPAASLPERCVLASDRNLYITYGNDPNGAIMKYNITNGVWTNCSPNGNLTYCGISVCATNPNKLIASTYSEWKWQPNNSYGDRFYVTTNGGATWNDLIGNSQFTMSPNGFPYIAPAAIHWAGSIEMDPFNSDRVFVGSGNGLFCTTNLNSGLTLSTWKFMVKGLEETVPINFLSIPNGLFITSVGDQGGFINTNITVAAPTNMSQSTSFAYAGNKSNVIARIVSNGELYYSSQLPVTWTKCPSTPGVMTNGSVAISADGTTLLWNSTVGGVATNYVTTNFGTNWVPSTGLAFRCNPEGDPQNPLKFYAYNSSDGYLYVSSNGGQTFARAGSVGTGGSSTFCVAPGWEGHVWVALNGSGLKYSTNSGSTFYSANVTEADAIAFGKTVPGATYPTLFIYGRPTSSSVVGMYRSTDKAATWVSVNDTNHQYGGRGNAGLIEGDKNVCGRVYMSSVGRGVPYMDSWIFVTNITVIPVACSVPVNGTVQLAASVWPTNASNPTFSWASTNAAIASVSGSGLVTGNVAGTTTITATTLDGSYIANTVVTVTNVTSPPWLTRMRSGSSNLVFSWPADHRGWLLQVQTNSSNVGLSTNWMNAPGSASVVSVTNTINPANGSVFYRLAYPN